jgi:hypothetical protein
MKPITPQTLAILIAKQGMTEMLTQLGERVNILKSLTRSFLQKHSAARFYVISIRIDRY